MDKGKRGAPAPHGAREPKSMQRMYTDLAQLYMNS